MRFGINKKVVGKCDAQNLSYKGAFKTVTGTFENLATHIGKGHPWMPALIDKYKPRWQSYCNEADILAADIDSGMTIEQALTTPFIRQHCALGIESSSSTVANHKFRLVFRLPRTLTTWQDIRLCNEYLIERLGVADRACKDASRFFFGAKDRQAFWLDDGATLPDTFIEDAIAWNDEREAEREKAWKAEAEKRSQYEPNRDRDFQLVKQALTFIPPKTSAGDGRYPECFPIAAAIVHSLGESDATTLIESWSPSIRNTTWDVPKIVESISRDRYSGRKAGLGLIFETAKTYGFVFPQQDKPMNAQPPTPTKPPTRPTNPPTSQPSPTQPHQPAQPAKLDMESTIVKVNEVLSHHLSPFAEQDALDRIEAESAVTKGAFEVLIRELRGRAGLALDDSEIRSLAQFVEWKGKKFTPKSFLPASLAASMISDAQALGIDPMMLWQYLMPAILSLLPKNCGIRMHSQPSPPIAYTAIIAETGAGKTRAEKLIMAPLTAMQIKAKELYTQKLKEYEKAIRDSAKNKDFDTDEADEPQRPIEEKFVFNVSTIQAVWQKLAGQKRHGSVWCRDEIAGLFKSFGQFSKGGDNEALEMILAAWDGGSQPIDRVDENKSFILENPRLSISGGLQPAVYRQIFKDPEDSQGLAARFLMIHANVTPVKNIARETDLEKRLPAIYDGLGAMHFGIIEPDDRAYEIWNDARYKAECESREHPIGAVRAWLRKFSGHITRIALAIHALECLFDSTKDRSILTADTMEKALQLGFYYRQQFELVQASAIEPTDLQGYLIKIWDMANSRSTGVTAREVLRNFPALVKIAKDAKREPQALVLDFFAQLSEQGRGRVEETPRTRRFFATFGINAPQEEQPADEPLEPATRAKLEPAYSQAEGGFEINDAVRVKQGDREIEAVVASFSIHQNGTRQVTAIVLPLDSDKPLNVPIGDVMPLTAAPASQPESTAKLELGGRAKFKTETGDRAGYITGLTDSEVQIEPDGTDELVTLQIDQVTPLPKKGWHSWTPGQNSV